MDEKDERRYLRQLEHLDRMQEHLERRKEHIRKRFNVTEAEEKQIREKHNDSIKHK